MKKICTKCKQHKPISDFFKRSDSKIGLTSHCKSCILLRRQNYRNNNPEKTKEHDKKYSENQKEYIIKYRENHREEAKERTKQWYKDNPERVLKYRENNKAKRSKNKRQKYNTNPLFKLKETTKNLICKTFTKNGFKKDSSTAKLLGCSYEYFKQYLESKFQNGMTWDNHGQYGWHIDHRTPLASAKTKEDVYKLCHFSNLQPLWWRDNISKRDKIA